MHIPTETYQQIQRMLPIACVDVMIVHNNKCLMLLRDNEPAKGQYWFPGGRILKGETIANAALRKAKEEANLSCEFVKIISVEETVFENFPTISSTVHTINVCCLLSCPDILNISIDKLHREAVWINKIDPTYHDAVKHPLHLIGFNAGI